MRRGTLKKRVGKTTAGALYVHVSLLRDLSPELRSLERRARRIAGPRSCRGNIIKFSHNKSVVSYLEYPSFFDDPHPALKRSVTVEVVGDTAGKTVTRRYSDNNPPILHRKELFISTNDPAYPRFAALTAQEEKAGILSSNKIGRRQQWDQLLNSLQIRIVDHLLISY